MNRIESLPDLDWSDLARDEILTTGQELIDMSAAAWQIGNFAIVGLVYRTYTSPPWMWMALAKGVTLRHLLDFRRRQELIPPGTLVGVREAHGEAIRFAKLFGFEETDGRQLHAGHVYIIMRRA
jgi:hypothetical protein